MKRSRILAPFAALLCVLLTVSLAACRTDPSVGGQAQPVATTDAAQAAAAQGAVSSGGLPGATTTVPAGTAPAGGSATAQTGYMPSATMVYPSGMGSTQGVASIVDGAEYDVQAGYGTITGGLSMSCGFTNLYPDGVSMSNPANIYETSGSINIGAPAGMSIPASLTASAAVETASGTYTLPLRLISYTPTCRMWVIDGSGPLSYVKDNVPVTVHITLRADGDACVVHVRVTPEAWTMLPGNNVPYTTNIIPY